MGQFSISFRSHPSQEAWESYALRQLTEEQIAPMEEHLFLCKQCQEILQEVDNYAALMKVGTFELLRAPAESKLKQFWRAVWPQSPLPRFAWASAAVAACLVVGLYVNTRFSTPRTEAFAAILSERGNASGIAIHVPAHRPLALRLNAPDVSSSSSLRVDVIGRNGEQVWSGQPKASVENVEVELSGGLSKGAYWVRLYDGSDLAVEYGLSVD